MNLLTEKNQQKMYAQSVHQLAEQVLFVKILLDIAIRFLSLVYIAVNFVQVVYSTLFQLGLPEWIVDLRHDATHAALPQLPYLRTVASFAWNWLKVLVL